MLHQIVIKTDCPVRHEHRDSKIDQLRAAIVSASKESGIITEDDMRWINFRPPPPYYMLPKILYHHPTKGRKNFSVSAFGDDGKAILLKMGKTLLKRGYINVGGSNIGIEDFEVLEDLPYMPEKDGKRHHYYTATPIVLYDKKRDHIEWYAVSKKFRESDPEEYDRQMKRSIANLIKANIVNQLKQRIGDREYSFVKEMDIHIEGFRFFLAHHHKEKPKTPMLFMTFSSDWTLPPFIGHHTGKGYGVIAPDTRRQHDKS